MASKRAKMPDNFDFGKVQSQIQAIIDSLDNPQGCETSTRLQAKEILIFWRNPTFVPSQKFAKNAETKKLRELLDLSKKLRSVWRDLDPDLQVVMRRELSRDRFIGEHSFSTDSERAIFSFVTLGPDLIERARRTALDAMADGEHAPSRTKWDVLRVVHACAMVWEERMGKTPKAASQTLWAEFVQNVFYCLGIDASVENSIRAWREQP